MAIVWWHWLALGLILIALELAASGGFYIIFFGVAAMVIAALSFLGIAGPTWFGMNWVVQPESELVWHNGSTVGFHSILVIARGRGKTFASRVLV